MNNVSLIGRTTADPVIRYSAGDKPAAICKFTLAVDKKWKRDGEPSADFIRCVAFGKTAEFVSKYFPKGRRMGLTGSIQTGNYKDKDGHTVYTTDIITSSVYFADGFPGAGPSAQSQYSPPPAVSEDLTPPNPPEEGPIQDHFGPEDFLPYYGDEDLPFMG